eukprot:250928_1
MWYQDLVYCQHRIQTRLNPNGDTDTSATIGHYNHGFRNMDIWRDYLYSYIVENLKLAFKASAYTLSDHKRNPNQYKLLPYGGTSDGWSSSQMHFEPQCVMTIYKGIRSINCLDFLTFLYSKEKQVKDADQIIANIKVCLDAYGLIPRDIDVKYDDE